MQLVASPTGHRDRGRLFFPVASNGKTVGSISTTAVRHSLLRQRTKPNQPAAATNAAMGL
jgi:hypothetical protein